MTFVILEREKILKSHQEQDLCPFLARIAYPYPGRHVFTC